MYLKFMVGLILKRKGDNMMYPKELFSINETVTKENLRQYEERKNLIYKKCEEIDPDFWKLPFRERMKIKAKAEKEV